MSDSATVAQCIDTGLSLGMATARPEQKTLLERSRVAITWICFVLMFGFVLCVRSHWQPGDLMTPLLLLSGLSLAVIGALGRVWCSLFIDGFKTQTLVTEGPYSVCRNPLYFFSALGVTGIACGSGTIVLPVAVLVLFAVFYPLIIRAEESRLQQLHGEHFEEYRRRVPAFFPGRFRQQLPEKYTIYPRLVWSGVLEASWFIWLTMLFHWIYQLHFRLGELLPAIESY